MEKHTVGTTQLELVRGDITEQAADVIVNAANAELRGGSGVDGAIHRVGGPSIMAQCDVIRAEQGGCPTGEVVATEAGDLQAKWVVHAVGPIWKGSQYSEQILLEQVYYNALSKAAELGGRTVVFPSISTGAYGFPVGRAAEISLMVIARYITEHPEDLDAVRMVLFSDEDFGVFSKELDLMVRTKLG